MLRDSNVVLEQDRKMPDYCWNTGISKDICEARTRVLPGTFSVDLLSDTEFLLYKLPKTGRGMSEMESALFVPISLWEVICGLVFRLTYSSHCELSHKREGIRLKHMIIAIGLWWSN